MRDELKPCPFCGSTASVARDKYGTWLGGCSNFATCVFCPSISTDSREKFVRLWNTRAAIEATGVVEAIEALTDAIDWIEAESPGRMGPAETAVYHKVCGKIRSTLSRIQGEG